MINEWAQEQPRLDTSAMAIRAHINVGKNLRKKANKAVSSFNIHYTDLDVLATIKRSGKPSKLMKSVLISSGAMTALLNKLNELEKAKLASLLKKLLITLSH